MNASIDLETQEIRPFGELRGTVRWLEGERPPTLELRLFWVTRGRGTEEIGLAATQAVALSPDGSAPFVFELPGEPYSFSGKLVGIVWGLELVDDQGEGRALREFVLSPDGRERQLGTVSPAERKGRGFRFRTS